MQFTISTCTRPPSTRHLPLTVIKGAIYTEGLRLRKMTLTLTINIQSRSRVIFAFQTPFYHCTVM